MTLNPRQRFLLETALFFVASLLLVGLAVSGRWLQTVDRLIYDMLIRAKSAPQAEDIVIVGIDDKSLDAIGPWPWPRSRQAELLRAINAASPRAVLVDVVYANPSEPTADADLVAAAADIQTLALPLLIDAVANRQQLIEVLPFHPLLEQADALGHVHVELDADAIVRGSYLYQGIGSAHWPHVTLALAEHLGIVAKSQYACGADHSTEYSITKHQCGYVYTTYVGGPGSFDQLSALDVLNSNEKLAGLTGKIVFVGVVASGTTDTLTTPVSGSSRAMSGIEYNANLFNALALGLVAKSAPPVGIYLLNFLAVSLPVLFLPRRKAKGMLATALLFAALPVVISGAALIAANVWVPLASALAVCLLAYPYWSWRRHEVAWQFVETEIQRLDEERARWGARPTTDPHGRVRALARFLGAELTKRPQSWIHDARHAIEIQGGEERLVRAEPFSEAESSLASRTISNIHQHAPEQEGLPGELLIAELRRLQELAEEVRMGREIGQRSLERMPSGVVVFSALGEVLFANSAARRFLKLGDSLPTQYEQLMRGTPPPLGQNWHDLARSVVLEGRTVSFETRAAGAEQVVVEASALADPTEVADSWVLTLTDMTDIHAAERDREEALAFLSHDLRSPMLSVLALVRGTDRHPPLDEIEEYAQRALQVSDQFLQLSRVQARENFERYEVNVLSVLSNALDQMYALARDKHIDFLIDPFVEDHEEGIWLLGNGELLQRAFENLFSNAIKYSDPESQVMVSVNAVPATIEITIADQGAGIPSDEIEFVFEPFFRSAAKELATQRGAGLGLRFVKTVIERHDGRIAVQSTYREGSRFTVSLPTLETEPQDPAAGQFSQG